MISNWNPTTTAGSVRAVCESCDRKSGPVDAQPDGRPSSWQLGAGWVTAPYPVSYIHADGSVGSRFVCPRCNEERKKRKKVAAEPLWRLTPQRHEAIRSRNMDRL